MATYNLENYLETASRTRPAKGDDAKAKIRESIRAINPDVLALQEIGGTNALLELRDALQKEGNDFPHWELVTGADTNINLAVLSRFPFSARRPHTRESFLLNGRRFFVSRGFLEVDVQVNPNYSFTLIAAHLKSRRIVAPADEAELRFQEAKLLREKIDARLAAEPTANLLVLGDLNDTKDAASTKVVIGHGITKLVDTHPAERNGDTDSELGNEARPITWTHYYAKEDVYSRIDFILASSGMAREWHWSQTYALRIPNWGLASDHRPIVASFLAEDK
ncbi:MAG TPA: endonuclease/exonuclease/phosphatase family protein [Candidatus Limnocylindrales bacterium]|nr:endonuclease/exonuclease/phosphatase family protein [Candidatus Limnocylindrales bacterium]